MPGRPVSAPNTAENGGIRRSVRTSNTVRTFPARMLTFRTRGFGRSQERRTGSRSEPTEAVVMSPTPLSPPTPTPSDIFAQPRLPVLDGIRLIAMVQVVIYHAGETLSLFDGVICFFVLSGFLFSWLLSREFREHGDISLRSFHRRRATRIIPALLGAIAATILLKWMLRLPVNYEHALASATFWGNYYNALHDHPPSGFASLWTLGVEQQFYVVFPIVLLLTLRAGGPALSLRVIAALGLLAAGWRIVAVTVLQASPAYIYNAFETRFDGFAVGALCGILVSSERFLALLRRLSQWAWQPLVPLALLAALELRGASPAWHFGVRMTLEAPLLACLMLQLVMLRESRFWSWLDHPLTRYGGALSYSGYLYHHIGLAVGERVPVIHGTVAGVLMTLVLAACSYHAIEIPAQRWLSRGAGRRRRSELAAAPLPATV